MRYEVEGHAADLYRSLTQEFTGAAALETEVSVAGAGVH
jgi:hypothetical protein